MFIAVILLIIYIYFRQHAIFEKGLYLPKFSFMRYFVIMLFVSLAVKGQNTKLKIEHLKGKLYIYTTYNLFSGNPFPSNSMYIVTDDGVVLFDTPWDENQFQPLLDSIEKKHNKKVVLCIATHYHEDRTAGLEYYKSKGIATYTSKQTYDLCVEKGFPKAEKYFVKDTVFTIGRKRIEAFYPGEGHTKDNIVIWVPDERVLYGGCLIKSTEAYDLGNIADANVTEWDKSIQNLIDRYPLPAYVVPGHFKWSRGRKSLKHTQELLKRHNRL